MSEFHQHGLQHSIISHLRNKLGIRVDWVFDGYKKPTEKPFITVEQMQNNNDILAKQREAVRTIYRFQVGLHAQSSTDRARLQERIKRIFLFDEITFLDTDKSPAQASGFFMCELMAEVPMPAGDVSNISDYHTVYFDIEVSAEHYKEAK
ncbi:hypothetical protein [Lederbergia citri]|uniref:Uncharacterized protein n=1 Tax=Lederbergia citri TaxID=2833580 RepID=A0A942TCL6_9BACI|nr:hypothetical protein [Lederbergia citri]MBS4195330.1 hypothetical protein [Lederbergia citri]